MACFREREKVRRGWIRPILVNGNTLDLAGNLLSDTVADLENMKDAMLSSDIYTRRG